MPYRARSTSNRKPTADWWEGEPFRPNLCVDGEKEVRTGLVDRFGNEIMRVQAPIGFGRDDEH